MIGNVNRSVIGNRVRRSGTAIIWVTFAFTAMVGFVSFAADYGRVQLAKTQLLEASDAAARAAVGTLGKGIPAAQTAAISVAAANTCDGSPVAITASDIQFGYFDTISGSFTVLTGTSAQNANAARV